MANTRKRVKDANVKPRNAPGDDTPKHQRGLAGVEGNGSAFLTANLAEAATAEQKQDWQGFCRIKSEPAIFNVMIREMGVKDVKFQEIYQLEEGALEEALSTSSKVHGFVLCYQYSDQGDEVATSDSAHDLWFANQLADDSCATVAILNLLNNLSDVDIGEPLRQFKNFTKEFNSPLKGEALNNYSFVKKIHNSFARKIEMLNADVTFKDKALKARQRRNRVGRSAGKKRKHRATEDTVVDGGAAEHYCAIIPFAGHVWRLDGLVAEPQSLGTYEEVGWIAIARDHLSAQMMADESGHFQLMAVVHDEAAEMRKAYLKRRDVLQDMEAQLEHGISRNYGPRPPHQHANSALEPTHDSTTNISSAKPLAKKRINRTDPAHTSPTASESRDAAIHRRGESDAEPPRSLRGSLGHINVDLTHLDESDDANEKDKKNEREEVSGSSVKPSADGQIVLYLTDSEEEFGQDVGDDESVSAVEADVNEKIINIMDADEDAAATDRPDTLDSDSHVKASTAVNDAVKGESEGYNKDQVKTLTTAQDAAITISESSDKSDVQITPTTARQTTKECLSARAEQPHSGEFPRPSGDDVDDDALKRAYCADVRAREAEDAYVADQRFDYGPLLRTWLGYLLENGSLPMILEDKGMLPP